MVLIDISPVKQKLQDILTLIQTKSGRYAGEAMQATVRNHFSWIYPGSKHYDPNKVNITNSTGNSATVNINVPGVTRAYRDLHITAKNANYLTIPIHKDSYGKAARMFNGLFCITKLNGTKLLALNNGSGIRFLYVLKKSVFLKQDKRLMPDDLTLVDNIFSRVMANIH